MSLFTFRRSSVSLVVALSVLSFGISRPAHAASPHFLERALAAAGEGDGLAMLYVFLYGLGALPLDDPSAFVSRTRDKGATFRDSTGAVLGTSLTSRTTGVGGGVDGRFNASRAFQLSGWQTLTLGAAFQGESYRTTFDPDPLNPAVGSAGSVRQSIYRLSGFARYDFGPSYLGLFASGNWGSGTETDNIFASTGQFDRRGYMVAGNVGHVFTLFDNTVRERRASAMPTKAPPAAIASGYSIKLDAGANVGYASTTIDGFTDTAGNVRGDEKLEYGFAGAHAKLFATTASGRWTLSPFVAGTVTKQFDYNHAIFFPAQFGAPDVTDYYGSSQTFWGVHGGLDIVDISGVMFGANFYYRTSQQFDVTGGQAYIRLPITRWLARNNG
jgi:hypothetical protein